MAINIGDVVDLKTTSFRIDRGASGHPAIVLDIDENTITVAICTDENHRSSFPYSISINWKIAGLTKPTIVICDKLGEVNSSQIQSTRGVVSKEDFRRIKSAIEIYGGNDRVVEDLIVNSFI